MHGLTLARKTVVTETTVKDLKKPIILKVPFNLAKAKAATQFWKQKINCNFYDTIQGKMSYDGCYIVSVESDHVVCNCTHLSDFAAGIDPSKPACGDGKLEGDEECDDENTASGDGCSDECVVEYGHVCWSVPSVCCAPCPAGEKRIGCTVAAVERSTGSCEACEAGKYKGSTLVYGSECSSCNTDSTGKGNYSTGGAVACEEHASCPAGSERSDHSITSPGTCAVCIEGKYKHAPGIYSTTCQDLTACVEGTYLTAHSASTLVRALCVGTASISLHEDSMLISVLHVLSTQSQTRPQVQ